jgi:ring-1,2-phenylacetyl-CoA epoxidase subunit PaaD
MVSVRADNACGESPQALPTPSDVWAAIARIPDPEIPVISLVDLGVVTAVEVSDAAVLVELTPTFLGCPALEAMTAAIHDELAALGVEAEVRVRTDREWTTDRISPEGREKLRAAGFAPPAPRAAAAPTLVQLERGPFRCPWCGSTDTKLENLFGPTPCRSLRYCNACRQPFEQFKTI